MERLLERNPTEVDLEEAFIPGVSFHFRYETIVNQRAMYLMVIMQQK